MLKANVRQDHTPATCFFVADSILTNVRAMYDQQGLPELYHARIFTPVCEVDKCYAIELELYWDLIGRYHHYDTVPGGGLTRLDHLPFTDQDYLKLNYILSNPNSVLASYQKDELVRDVRDSEIDGFTGATIAEVKETVIPGAVYSCHTLWHIAHGAVRDSLRIATREKFSKELVNKLVDRKDQEVNYFLIDNLSEEEYLMYLPAVLRAISDGEAYFAKNAIERMPPDALADSLAQNFFAGYFSDLNYFAQVSLLKKLDEIALNNELIITLKNNLDERNSYKNDLIRHLLESKQIYK